jgi:hypothetical protein
MPFGSTIASAQARLPNGSTSMTSDDRRPRRPPPPDVVALALDIGGTKLAAGVVTGDGRVLSRAVIPARATEGPWSMIDRHVDLGRQVVREAGMDWAHIAGIGIACGGPLDPDTGIIQSPPNLPGWDRIPLVDTVSERLGLPAAVENDATAGALAEWWFGAGRSRGVDDLVYLTISTGIGGGLVLGGRLYTGVAGNAGELGHLTVIYDGRQCGCGRRGRRVRAPTDAHDSDQRPPRRWLLQPPVTRTGSAPALRQAPDAETWDHRPYPAMTGEMHATASRAARPTPDLA